MTDPNQEFLFYRGDVRLGGVFMLTPISHWHGDHVGGLEALAKLIPLGRFYDHGDGVEEADRPRLESYKTVAGAKRTIVKGGDTIPFRGVQMRVLVSEGPVIASPINGGGPNRGVSLHARLRREDEGKRQLVTVAGSTRAAPCGHRLLPRHRVVATPILGGLHHESRLVQEAA